MANSPRTRPTRFLAYLVKFLGPTKHNGPRIKITNEQTRKSVTLAASDLPTCEHGVQWLKDNGAEVVGYHTADLASEYTILVVWSMLDELPLYAPLSEYRK